MSSASSGGGGGGGGGGELLTLLLIFIYYFVYFCVLYVPWQCWVVVLMLIACKGMYTSCQQEREGASRRTRTHHNMRAARTIYQNASVPVPTRTDRYLPSGGGMSDDAMRGQRAAWAQRPLFVRPPPGTPPPLSAHRQPCDADPRPQAATPVGTTTATPRRASWAHGATSRTRRCRPRRNGCSRARGAEAAPPLPARTDWDAPIPAAASPLRRRFRPAALVWRACRRTQQTEQARRPS